VRRAENALADQLANQALDRHKHAARQRSG